MFVTVAKDILTKTNNFYVLTKRYVDLSVDEYNTLLLHKEQIEKIATETAIKNLKRRHGEDEIAEVSSKAPTTEATCAFTTEAMSTGEQAQ